MSNLSIFVLIAGVMAVVHIVAAVSRPRPGVIVSGLLWCGYLVYEYLIAIEVLCDAKCNIRVDLLFFMPILALVTYCAWRSYRGRPAPWKVVGGVLGAIGLVIFALIAESYGYSALSNVVIVGCTIAYVVYVIRSRRKAKSETIGTG